MQESRMTGFTIHINYVRIKLSRGRLVSSRTCLIQIRSWETIVIRFLDGLYKRTNSLNKSLV
jgi:hypothetical protein